MFELNLDPYLLHTGDFSLRWYAVLLFAGVAAGMLTCLREARWRGFSVDVVANLGVLGVISGIIGARLLHVLDYLSLYLDNPLRIVALQDGGLSVYGALLAGIAAGALYLGAKRLPVLAYLDLTAPGIMLGLVVGRIGNLINGDAWGKDTGGQWGLVYTNSDVLIPSGLLNVPTHPVPLYEILGGLVIFTLLWQLRLRFKQPGLLFALFMLLYALLRIATGFYRENNLLYLDLNQAQLLGLLMTLIFGASLIVIGYRNQALFKRENEKDVAPVDAL